MRRNKSNHVNSGKWEDGEKDEEEEQKNEDGEEEEEEGRNKE